MELTANERSLLVAGAKTLFSHAKGEKLQYHYAAIIDGLNSPEVDAFTLKFIKSFSEIVMQSIEKRGKQELTEEDSLRLSVVKDIYAGLQRKVILEDGTK